MLSKSILNTFNVELTWSNQAILLFYHRLFFQQHVLFNRCYLLLLCLSAQPKFT